ncbi:hypothetical protein OBA47_01480 [bacterium]|nr:hypothetical protein [bacterium]
MTSKENGYEELKKIGLNVSVETKRCHLRKSEFVYWDTKLCAKGIKKPQPQGLEPGDGERPKHTDPKRAGKAMEHYTWRLLTP